MIFPSALIIRTAATCNSLEETTLHNGVQEFTLYNVEETASPAFHLNLKIHGVKFCYNVTKGMEYPVSL